MLGTRVRGTHKLNLDACSVLVGTDKVLATMVSVEGAFEDCAALPADTVLELRARYGESIFSTDDY